MFEGMFEVIDRAEHEKVNKFIAGEREKVNKFIAGEREKVNKFIAGECPARPWTTSPGASSTGDPSERRLRRGSPSAYRGSPSRRAQGVHKGVHKAS
jgi:hypothetical protein